MQEPTPINPDPADLTDRMKHGFFVCSRELAELQYRLAELAGEGELNPNDNWKHNQFLLGEGAVNEYPRGTISSIAPIRTSGELVDDGRVRRRNTDFDALRKLLQQPGTGGHE